jgi:hypothetical protein
LFSSRTVATRAAGELVGGKFVPVLENLIIKFLIE